MLNGYSYPYIKTISTSRAVSSLGSCGSLIYHDFNTISTSLAVSSLGSCGSLIYHDFNTISTSQAVSSLWFTYMYVSCSYFVSLSTHTLCVHINSSSGGRHAALWKLMYVGPDTPTSTHLHNPPAPLSQLASRLYRIKHYLCAEFTKLLGTKCFEA